MGFGLFIVVLIFGILVGAYFMFSFYKKDVEICDMVGNKLYISFWGKESMDNFEELVKAIKEQTVRKGEKLNGHTD